MTTFPYFSFKENFRLASERMNPLVLNYFIDASPLFLVFRLDYDEKFFILMLFEQSFYNDNRKSFKL